MVKCPVCGQTYGVTHSCPGPPAPRSPHAGAWASPGGFAPLHYFRQAIAIARLDDDAVMSASIDARSLAYGATIWLIGQTLAVGHVIWVSLSRNQPIRWPVLIIGSVFVILIDATWVIAQYGICHLLARRLFEARGTFIRILRPLLLGSIVGWLLIIPYIGRIAAGLWAIAVMMIVFEDVDDITRIKAFGLSFGVGIVFLVVANSFLKPG